MCRWTKIWQDRQMGPITRIPAASLLLTKHCHGDNGTEATSCGPGEAAYDFYARRLVIAVKRNTEADDLLKKRGDHCKGRSGGYKRRAQNGVRAVIDMY